MPNICYHLQGETSSYHYHTMKIYTKKGDKGQTSLCCGEKVPKNSLRVEAYGSIDELSSNIGLAISLIRNGKIKKVLKDIQHDLAALGAHAATVSPKMQEVLPKFPASKITKLEKTIDELDKKLPELKRFVLPGGTCGASALHVARTVCRRAERVCVALAEKEKIYENIIPYLNRLSDLLFVLARTANKGKDAFA